MGRIVKILGSLLGTVWFNMLYLPLGDSLAVADLGSSECAS